MEMRKYYIRLKPCLRGKVRKTFIRECLGLKKLDALPFGWWENDFTIILKMYPDFKTFYSVQAKGDDRVKAKCL